jgi:hypothetical protein
LTRIKSKPAGGAFAFVGMDTGRFSDFTVAMAQLGLPKGWTVNSALNYDCAHACNHHVRTFKGDHLLLMGDDHRFPGDIIGRLLRHKVDIVAALCMERRPPFRTVARVAGNPLPLDTEPGLIEVDSTGTAGMLIHRRVFDALEPPWFWHGEGKDGFYLADDIFFCARAREAGFKIHVDTSTVISHLAVLEVAPHFNGAWTTKLSVGDREFLSIKGE